MISQNDIDRYINIRNKVLTHNSQGKYAMAVSIYYKRKFIGYKFNAYPKRRAGETYSSLYRGIGVHAELAALSKYDITNCTLYLVGVNSNLTEITSKPCPRCNNLLLNSKVKAIVYYDKDIGLVKVKRKDLTLLAIPEYNK